MKLVSSVLCSVFVLTACVSSPKNVKRVNPGTLMIGCSQVPINGHAERIKRNVEACYHHHKTTSAIESTSKVEIKRRGTIRELIMTISEPQTYQDMDGGTIQTGITEHEELRILLQQKADCPTEYQVTSKTIGMDYFRNQLKEIITNQNYSCNK